jgi:predicted phosphodiesterase
MVCYIISDIHANLEALNAVLHAFSKRENDAIYCLGDLVGYNADPDICVKEVLSRAASTVRGNHDKAVCGALSLDWFNPIAREAALWTRKSMDAETRDALCGVLEGPRHVGEGIIICHGTPEDEDAYMIGPTAIRDSFRFLEKRFPEARCCFFGHTHVPLIVKKRAESGRISVVSNEREVHLEPGSVYLINPGSVGQPRDGNPKASFGILDTGKMVYHGVRVGYDLAETQRKISAAGLPEDLARRLEEGW